MLLSMLLTAIPEVPELFPFLEERIPGWLRSLQAISEGTERRQTDNFHGPQAAAASGTANDFERTPGTETPPSRHYIPQQQAPRTKRKRRSSSMTSTCGSICNKYRARNAISVVYDAGAQKCLEDIVNEIGKAKHLVRKAKAKAELDAIKRQPMKEDSDVDSDMDDDAVMAKVRLQRASLGSQTKTKGMVANRTEAEGILEQVDKVLEQAQDLCLSAAFQLLRDGDCSIETNNAGQRLEEVSMISRQEMFRLGEAMKRAAEVHVQELLRETEKAKREDNEIMLRTSPNVREDFNCATEIRVTEDDDEFPLAPLRLTSRLIPH